MLDSDCVESHPMEPLSKTHSSIAAANPRRLASLAREYYELTKPRVVSLIIFTAVVGMFLSTPGAPPLSAFLLGTLGIALAAGSAAAMDECVLLRGSIGRGILRNHCLTWYG